MWIPYWSWLLSKLLLRRPPLLRLAKGAVLGNWISFSEYYSFQDIIPARERLFLERHMGVNPTSVAFDVGANVGAFTCLLAAVGAREVHAFEPIAETFCRLRANVMANGLLDRCRLNCLALGRENGLVTFRVQSNSPATNRLFVGAGGPAESSAITQTVASVRLDDYCRAIGVEHIDFLKIDVEGMEAHVLEGAHRLLREKRVGGVLIEACPANLRSVGLSPEVLYDTIVRSDYSPFELREDGTAGRRLYAADLQAATLANIVLLPT